MRIVNREEFLKLPNGTLFSKYSPCVMGELMIKEDSLTNDFIYQDINDAIDCTGSDDFFDKLMDSQENGTELAMDFDCCGRDGCFDEDQLFSVWSNDDRLALIKRLEECSSNV
jgi:hypothetical protein